MSENNFFKKIYDFFDLQVSPFFNVLTRPFMGIYNALQIAVKVLLILAITFSGYQYLNKVFYNREINNGTMFKSMPENSLDVIVLGSSHAQYSFVPAFFYEDTGLYSYVLGSACQPYEVSYEMLREALKTQNPKMVIMEVFTAMPISSECEGDSCYVIAQAQMTGEEKYSVISYLPEEKAEAYRNEFFNYHNDWKTVSDWSIILPENQERKVNVDKRSGYVYLEGNEGMPDNWWRANTYSMDADVILDPQDVKSLQDIYDLCKEKGIELIFYKTPIDGIDVENQSYLHQIWKWADEHNIKYIDFIDKQHELDFYMELHALSFHCTITGAAIVTDYLADVVNKGNYSFEHKDNSELNTLYHDNALDMTSDYMRFETNPRLFINRLKNSEGITVVSFNYNGENISPKMYQWLLSLGLNPGDFTNNSSYYAIVKDGEVLSCGHEGASYNFGVFSVNTKENFIEIGGEKTWLESNLMITYINQHSGLISHKNIDLSSSWQLNKVNYIYD